MAAHPIGSKEWKEEFARTRDAFVASLRASVVSCSEVVCQPCSRDYTFGWSFEQGHTEHPWKNEGDLNYGVAYLRHMYDQGLMVAFGVTIQDQRATVYLKAWEGSEPPWPSGFAPTITGYRS